MSDTANVKLGVCKITFGGVDLGYTKGGVEVEVTTDTHPVTVDQFGESIVNEYITKRDIKVKAPLAETTLDNLVNIMPGATLVSDGVKATGDLDFGVVNAVADDTITVNGIAFTFKASPATPVEIAVGVDVATSVANAVAVLNASLSSKVALASYAGDATTVTATYKVSGLIGNTFTLAASVATASGATLTTGAEATSARVDVENGIGANLLTGAKHLKLHPIELVETDESEDLNIPLAATAGAMNFAYKHDEERVYNTEFTGYPDPTSGLLFQLGDLSA